MLKIAPTLFRRCAEDRRGSVAIMFAFSIFALVGTVGLAIDFGRAFRLNSEIRAALDAAVLGAISVSSDSKTARATSIFKANNPNTFGATVTPTFALAGDGTFSGTVSVNLPTTFAKVFHVEQMTFTVGSKARSAPGSTEYCVLALATSGKDGITTNGAPKANLGCNIMSNTTARCNGHNLGAPIGSAHTTNSGCGVTQESNVEVVSDPYSGRTTNIPSNPCISYPQVPAKKSSTPLPASNLWSGAMTLGGNRIICGDLQLIGNTTIIAPSGAVLVIENGQLNTNGFRMQTAPGSALTIVFTGSNSAIYQHIPSGGGTLDITAPTTGSWSGIAIYQDPSLTVNVDLSAAGNSPTWNITGLVYLPHSNVTFSGAVNKSSNGLNCLGMVVDNITINGTGSIFNNNNQCASAGLALPASKSSSRLTN